MTSPRQSLFSLKRTLMVLVLGAVLAVSLFFLYRACFPAVSPPVAAVSRITGVPRAVLQTLEADRAWAVGLLPVLQEKARDYLDLKDRWGRFHTDNRDVRRHRQKAERALEAGRFQDALGHLETAVQTTTDPRETAQILSDQAGVSTMILSQDTYKNAVQLYGRAAALVQDTDPQAARTYRLLQAETLVVFSENRESEEGILVLKDMVQTLDRTAQADDWARAQAALGDLLSTLPELGRYEDAVVAYQAALEVYDQDQTPMEWAKTQIRLGTVLSRLGWWVNPPQLLDDAVVAYQAALEVYDQERTPMEWAMAQVALGEVLVLVGTRQDDPQRLEAAVVAFRAAAGVYDHDLAPHDWAMIQHGLGRALASLGKRTRDLQPLGEAVVALRAAQDGLRETGMTGDLMDDLEGDIARIEDQIKRLSPPPTCGNGPPPPGSNGPPPPEKM